MLPTRIDAQTLPPPPGIIGSLKTGFDAIASHLGLILLPVALDLLLWLGPRVSIERLMQPVLGEMQRLAPGAGVSPADVSSMIEMYRELLTRLNLLAVLRTMPLGIFSLMSGRMPALSPLGAPLQFQLESGGQMLGLLVILTLAGWILGGLYFHGIADLVTPGDLSGSRTSAGRAVRQTLVYSFIWMMLLWVLGLPAVFIIYITYAINSTLGQGVLLLMAFASLWLLVPMFFSPHGIFARNQNAFASFLSGFQLTRFTLPSSSLFVLLVFLVGGGLNSLWSVPAEDSWLAGIGILGHAFITTALLASSFVYYRDMTAWVQTVLERLRAGLPVQRA